MDLDDDILREFDQGSAVRVRERQDQKDLARWMVAERESPEIMPYQTELLDRLMENLRQQIELVERESGNQDPTVNFKLIIVQTDLERVKFTIRAYLRARMHKIDEQAVYLVSPEGRDVRGHLSPTEAAYMKSHLALLNNHYLDSFLRQFPEGMRRLDENHGGSVMVEAPDYDSAVFCKVVRDIGDTGWADLHLLKDQLYIIRYSMVRQHVMSGAVELI